MLNEAEDSGRAATIIYNEMYGVNDRTQSPGLRTFGDRGLYDSIYPQRISPWIRDLAEKAPTKPIDLLSSVVGLGELMYRAVTSSSSWSARAKDLPLTVRALI